MISLRSLEFGMHVWCEMAAFSLDASISIMLSFISNDMF